MGAAARPLGVEHEHLGVGRHQVDEQLHLVDQRRRQRLHALDRDAGGDLVGQLEQLRVLLAELGGPPAYVVGEQQLAARRCPEPVDACRGCAGRRPRTSGSPRRRRPRTPPAAGAPRSAGRRRRCRRGPRTRRASPPGRPACTPRRPAGVRRRRARPGWPTASSTGSRSPSPLTCGCSIDRTGATTTDSGPLAASGAGCHSRRSTASRRPTVSLRGLSRSCGQRLPARVVADPGRVDQVAERGDQVLGLPRRGGDGEHGRLGAHAARPPGTAAAPSARSGRACGRRRRAAAIARAGSGVGEDGVGEAGE